MSDVKVGAMRIVDTTRETMSLQATVNFSNPTDYSVHVPFMDIKFLNNGSVLGHGTVRNMTIVPGQNENIVAEALWAPWAEDGERGAEVARELLSQFISGRHDPAALTIWIESLANLVLFRLECHIDY